LCFSSAAHLFRIARTIACSADSALRLELAARATVVVGIITHRVRGELASLGITTSVTLAPFLATTIALFALFDNAVSASIFRYHLNVSVGSETIRVYGTAAYG